MTSKKAPAVLRPAVTTNPSASMSTFTVLPFPSPTADPTTYLAPREQNVPQLMTLSFPPGQPVVLPAFPGIPLVAGNAGHGPTGTGAGNIIFQVRSAAGRTEPPPTQTLLLTQAPFNVSAPGTLCPGVAFPAPQFFSAPVVQGVILAPAIGGTQTVQGGWNPGLLPQVPQQAAQLVPPIVLPVNAGPLLNGASREGILDTSQSLASLDYSCNPTSVYENFRRWQQFKALAWSHLPRSPDAEALSCFLIPVLRSLSRRKPTMTLEEGLKRAMREWQHTSNFDRMIYYEMAEKFMEFEEEDMQIQKSQCMKGAQGLHHSVSPRPDPSEPQAPVVGSQPVSPCIPKKAIPKIQPATAQPHRSQRPQESKAPKEIPPEAVQEYMDIMDELVGPAHSAVGEPGVERKEDRQEPQKEDDGSYLDPDLLSYIDELCSQEDFITKGVERKEDRQEPQQEDDGTYLDPDLLSYIDELCSQEDFITKGVERKEDRQEPQQEDDGTYLDPDLLSYIDELCSQEDFITKGVERKEDRQEPQQEDDGTFLDPDLLSYIDELCSQEDFITKRVERKEDRQEPQQEDDGTYLDPGLLSYIDELCSQEELITKGMERKEDRQEPQQEDDGTYLDPDLLSYIDELCSQEDFITKGVERKEDRQEPQQEDDGTYLDPGLLSYIDELCSQEEFITKAEAVIHPQFLEYLLSPEGQRDPLGLAEELELEEALTLAQLVEKRSLTLKENKSVQAPSSHGAPQFDSHHSESEVGADARRRDHDPQLGVSDKACPPEADFKVHQRHCGADAHLSRPKASDVSSGCQESPAHLAQWSLSPPKGHRHTASGVGPSDATIPIETSSIRETPRLENWCSEEEEVLPSLSFLLGSQNRLLPWQLPQSPVPASGLVVPGGWCDQGASQSLCYQRIGLSHVDPSGTKSRKRPLDGDSAPAEKSLPPNADLEVPERAPLALGSVLSSQSQKIKCDPFVTVKRRKLR